MIPTFLRTDTILQVTSLPEGWFLLDGINWYPVAALATVRIEWTEEGKLKSIVYVQPLYSDMEFSDLGTPGGYEFGLLYNSEPFQPHRYKLLHWSQAAHWFGDVVQVLNAEGLRQYIQKCSGGHWDTKRKGPGMIFEEVPLPDPEAEDEQD